jgi:hypothetical protein
MRISLLLTTVASCNNISKNSKDETNEAVQTITFDKTSVLNRSQLTDEVRFVPLEVTDESMFSEVSQLNIIGEEIFLFDIRLGKLIVFDKNGTFKRVLERKGQGPGEYSFSMSFSASLENDKIYLVDVDNKLICYELDSFQYLYEKKGVGGINVFALSDETFVWFNYTVLSIGNESYKFHIITTDNEMNVISKSIPIPFESGYLMSPVYRFYTCNLDLYVFPPFDNVIYKYANNRFQPYYSIEYGRYSVPPLDFLSEGGEGNPYLNRLVKSDYVSFAQPFENDSFLLMSYFVREIKHLGIYNKISKKSFNMKFDSLEDKHNFLYHIHGVDETSFISCMNFEDLKKDRFCDKEKSFIELCKNNQISDDAPILIFFRFNNEIVESE